MQLRGALSGKVFGFDSKPMIRKWVDKDGVEKHLKILMSVSVNPEENQDFEEEYDKIMKSLFSKFGLERKRHVYSSSEIGGMFPPADPSYSNFCLAFTRAVMSLPDVKYSFFVTSLNRKHLQNGEVTINGEYGSTTRKVSIEEFMNLLADSYNVISAWKLCQITGIRRQTIIIDGTDTIRDCEAWDFVKKTQNVRIIYNADKLVPVVSTADIILRNLDWFIKTEKSFIDEKAIEKIIHYDDKVPSNNKFYRYIGNPDLEFIKPKSERVFSSLDLVEYLQRPIFYLYAGGMPQQKELLEEFPEKDEIYDAASSLYGSIKIFDHKKDGRIIGNNPEVCDFFCPYGDDAVKTLQILKSQKRNIEEFKQKKV